MRGVLRRLPTHLGLILLVVVWATPPFALLVSSLRPAQDVLTSGWWEAFTPPLRFTLDNYQQVLATRGLGASFLNSVTITLPATVAVVALGAAGGYAFARGRFRGRDGLFLLVTALLSIPIQLTLVPVLRVFAEWGIVGSFPAVWIAHVGYALPFAIYLMRNFFSSIPEEVFEAAAVDGAGELRAFLQIAIPLAAPALAAVAIFVFMAVWNDLLVALIYLGGTADVAPLTVTVANMVNSKGEGWQLLTAAAFVLMIVPMVVFFGLQRFFVRGLVAGAVR